MGLWWLALVLGVLVIGVVAFLLNMILQTAKGIHGVASSIWDGGTRIANNTVHVPDLARTNGFAQSILKQAPELLTQLGRIKGHAETCPGCPNCVVGGKL
jgi:hypothetical protein